MGGSKPSRTRKVLGNLSNSRKERKNLSNSIKEQEPTKIVENTVEVLKKSEHAVKNLSSVIDMYDFFEEYKDITIPDEKIKDTITDFWLDKKDKNKLKTDVEIDRIIINSAAKILKGGSKK